MGRLKPSVRVPARPDPYPGPDRPPGKAPKTRAALVLGAHLCVAMAAWAVFFLPLDEGLRGGLIGVIVRDALGYAARVYDYFLPQND